MFLFLQPCLEHGLCDLRNVTDVAVRPRSSYDAMCLHDGRRMCMHTFGPVDYRNSLFNV